ncbi:MAG: metallophosphoesterase [Halobacteriales archaeon]|nr:metallophosphoesterase [Halobacteriales archaeon]
MRVSPCFRERAILLEGEEGHVIVIGDVHVGLEQELARNGVRVPDQTPRLRERIDALLAETGADRLVVLGDLKETIGSPTDSDRRKLRDLFRGLQAKLDLVPGNHDFDLGWLGIEKVELHEARGLRIGDVGLAHGHVWPTDEVMQARTLVTSHNHPMVGLRDELGKLHKEPCWVRGTYAKKAREKYPGIPPDAQFVIMPAFNELLGGTAINVARADGREEGLGPLMKNGLFDVEHASVYTLDGIEVGTIRDLRAQAKKGVA